MAGAHVIGPLLPEAAVSFVAGLAFFVLGTMLLLFACGTSTSRLIALWAPRSSAATEWASAWIGGAMHFVMQTGAKLGRIFARRRRDEQDDYEDEDTQAEEFVEEEPQVDADGRIEPSFGAAPFVPASEEEDNDEDGAENVTCTRLPHHPHSRQGEEEAHRSALGTHGGALRDAVDQAAAAGALAARPRRVGRRASGECARARRRASGFRRQRRDHQCAARPRGHACTSSSPRQEPSPRA